MGLASSISQLVISWLLYYLVSCQFDELVRFVIKLVRVLSAVTKMVDLPPPQDLYHLENTYCSGRHCGMQLIFMLE
jgi:hypothetical protein